MKEGSNELFVLIKSLSRTEKRYFKLYANSFGSTDFNYIHLFDILDKLNDYDEKKVIKQFFGGKEAKHFSNIKKHLYNIVLKSLNKYQASNSKEAEMIESFNSCKILYRKGLYEQSLKLVEKLLNTCVQYEFYYTILNICELKIELLGQTTSTTFDLKSEYQKTREISKTAINILSIEAEYVELFTYFFEEIRTKGEIIRKKDQITELEAFMQNPLLINDEKALSIKSKNIYFFIKSIFYFLISDNENASKFGKLAIEYLEKENKRIPIDMATYSARLSNACEIFLRNKDFDQFNEIMDKLKKCPINSTMEEAKLFYRENNLMLKFHNIKENYVKTIEIYEKIIPIIESDIFVVHKSRLISIHFSALTAYFSLKEYKKSNQILNILLDEKSAYRTDILCFARIINCLIQLEVGDYNSQESALRATSYFMKKHEMLHEFENIFLKYYLKLIKLIDEKQRINVYQEFNIELKSIFENPLESVINIEFFDFNKWLKDKIGS